MEAEVISKAVIGVILALPLIGQTPDATPAASGRSLVPPLAAGVAHRLNGTGCVANRIAGYRCTRGNPVLGSIGLQLVGENDRVAGANWKVDIDRLGQGEWANRNFALVRQVFVAIGLHAVASDPWLASAIRRTRTDYCPQEKYYGKSYVVVYREDFVDVTGHFSQVDVYLGGDPQLLASIKERVARKASSCR